MSSFSFFRSAYLRLGALAVVALFGSHALTGCGIVDQITANEIAVGVLLQSPAAKDPRYPTGVKTLPQVTTFNLLFADVNKSAVLNGKTSASDVTPIPKATVTLQFHDPDANKDISINVTDQGAGKYGVDSSSSQNGSQLVFKQTQYTATIVWSGKTYKLQVTPPLPVKIKEFEATPVITNYTAGTDFTVTRDPSTDTNVAFVELASLANNSVNQVYTNAPKDVVGFINLVVEPSAWKTPSFTIPGSNFQASTPYLVSLATLAQGGSVEGDASLTTLSTGSTFLAGTTSGGSIVTK
jgi:hypothetical protein